jgi:hypothetical protein
MVNRSRTTRISDAMWRFIDNSKPAGESVADFLDRMCLPIGYETEPPEQLKLSALGIRDLKVWGVLNAVVVDQAGLRRLQYHLDYLHRKYKPRYTVDVKPSFDGLVAQVTRIS